MCACLSSHGDRDLVEMAGSLLLEYSMDEAKQLENADV
jgi:hypothetical protein